MKKLYLNTYLVEEIIKNLANSLKTVQTQITLSSLHHRHTHILMLAAHVSKC